MSVLGGLDLCRGRNNNKVPRHDRMRNHLVWGDAVTKQQTALAQRSGMLAHELVYHYSAMNSG